VAENMTDDEQLQILKNWWKENGRSLILIVSLAVIAYLGWQWWTRYQQQYSEEASAIYVELMETVAQSNEGEKLTEEKRSTANYLIEQLQNDYSRTFYSVSAALLAAKLAMEDGDLGAAEQQLNIAIDLGDEEIKTLANLRLANVYLAQGKHDEALALSEYTQDDNFTGLFAALRGDVFVAMGKIEDARSAYETAKEKLGAENTLQQRLVAIKLSDLPPGDNN
jgi:predicted negative regulator of RcsB-dependent stress response